MKVLLIFTFNTSLEHWDKRGIISREISLYKNILEKDHEVYFLTYDDKKDFKFSELLNGIKVVPALKSIKSSNRRIILIKSFFLPILLRKIFKKIDIIKTNQLEGSWVAWIGKIIFRKKLIVRGGFEWLKFYILHNITAKNKKNLKYWIKYFWIYIVELISYKLADTIILTNPIDIEFIVRTFKLKKKKIKLIYNFIDTNHFKPQNIKKKEKHALFIGRFTLQKNLFNLLEAYEDLKGFSLDLIGDGPYKRNLLEKAEEYGINLNFLGVLPNDLIPSVLNQYDIFILPSFFEGNPKVLLEAMSCGVACIGTNVQGINDIIQHKQNGFLCNTSSKSIRNAILELHDNKELKDKLGRNAREFIIKNCSLNSISNKEYDLYKNILKKNRRD